MGIDFLRQTHRIFGHNSHHEKPFLDITALFPDELKSEWSSKMAFIASASALWEMDTKGAQKGRLENSSFSEILFKKAYFEKRVQSRGREGRCVDKKKWKMSFDFCQIIPFLWNYDHFSFQEVTEFLVGKDAVLGKSWNAISSLATFAGASSVILLKLHWSAAETLHTTKRGPLKCSRRYMATKRPVFWFFHNLPKKWENLHLFSSIEG